MYAINLKPIPKPLYEQLKQRAKENRRSLNSEALACLEQAVMPTKIDPDAVFARVDAILKEIKITPPTDAMIRRARNKGRP